MALIDAINNLYVALRAAGAGTGVNSAQTSQKL